MGEQPKGAPQGLDLAYLTGLQHSQRVGHGREGLVRLLDIGGKLVRRERGGGERLQCGTNKNERGKEREKEGKRETRKRRRFE